MRRPRLPGTSLARLVACASLGAVAAGLGGACTTVIDTMPEGSGGDGGGDADGGGGDATPDSACDPDPCVLKKRVCEDGECLGCLPGHVEDDDGFCVPEGDPCDPDPCEGVHKACVGGFCGACLPGFLDDGKGACLAETVCHPSPCTDADKALCMIGEDGLPVCLCSPGAHDDGLGGCTFDPCTPNPCVPPLSRCSASGALAACGCPEGMLEKDGDCVADPCVPNPCTGYAMTTCATDDAGAAACSCDPGFADDGPEGEGGTCVETAVQNLESVPPPDGDVVVDHALQLFADDWLVGTRAGLARVLHPASTPGAWVVQPDPDAFIERARASGSLVFVDDETLAALPEDDLLKPYPWRLYYMGYRQLWTFDAEPAWLCLAVASSPEGPWLKPPLDPESPAPHCALRLEGMTLAEVTRRGASWTLSLVREALGSVAQAGLYVYASSNGVSWTPENGGSPVVLLSDTAKPPAAYPRIGERSRLVWDPLEERFLGLFALPSPALGDARGVMAGTSDPALGWLLEPDPLSAPAVLGPSAADLAAGRFLGDMVAWREGGLWLAFVQKRLTSCPKTAYATLATSRDGRHWAPVRDELDPFREAVIPNAPETGQSDSSIETLTGGAPARSGSTWHVFSGGITHGPCGADPAKGGIVHHVFRVGGLAGLQVTEPGAAVLITRPLRMAEHKTGSVFHLNATVEGSLTVQVEALTEADTIQSAESVAVPGGDYVDQAVGLPPLNVLTSGRFRIRFSFQGGGGELFGFRFSDPACNPNPCAEPGKATCDSSTGEVLCVCDPPTHDDGQGGCTTDPCTPDPCTGPHEVGCTAAGGEASCGCEDGWVKAKGLCVPDPCLPKDGVPLCQPPGPDKCQAVDGVAQCHCPDGSAETAAGCVETDARVFVTGLEVSAESLGGPGGADLLCASLAQAADLPGSWAAWLSTSGTAAKDRLGGAQGPWRTWDPEVGLWTRLVASSPADLVDGALAAPIDRTEFGAAVAGKCLVWTGTTASGGPVPPGDLAQSHCQDWTGAGAADFGQAGTCTAADDAWTAWAPVQCAKKARIYCFELASGPPPAEDGAAR